MLEALDTGVGREEAGIGFAEIDTDHDNGISFEEFIDWWSER
jgi:hypothetical protein